MINKLEREAMKLLLSGDDQLLAALRIQYDEAHVKSIDFTGVGLYVNYEVPDSVVSLPRTLLCFWTAFRPEAY